MKSLFKFSVAMIFILMTSLSGCMYPGERWDHDRGGDHGGDRGGDRGGDHGGDRGDEDGYRR